MLGGMAENPQRPRLIFDCPERLRRAIKIRAAKAGLGTSEAIVRILEAALSKELREADESLAGQPATESEPPSTARKGRKSSSP
jgi:plasmid stability protein